MFHYLVVVNYSNKEAPPSYSAVMSPVYLKDNLTIEDKKRLYDILKLKIDEFLKNNDHKDTKLYKEIRIFKIEEFNKEDIINEIVLNFEEEIDIDREEISLNSKNYQFFNLLMAFKDYEAFQEFEKSLQ